MFTRVFLFCLCVLFSHALRAQRSRNDINAGFVMGVNASQIDGDRAHGYNNTGAILGGFVNLPLSDAVSIQPEMLYLRLGGRTGKGGNIGFSGTGGPVDVAVSALSLPFLLKFQMGNQADWMESVDFFFGPALGVQLYGRDLSARGNNPEIAALNRYDTRLVLGTEMNLGGIAALNLNFSYSVTPVLSAEIVQEGSFLRPNQAMQVAWRHNYVSLSLRINILRDK